MTKKSLLMVAKLTENAPNFYVSVTQPYADLGGFSQFCISKDQTLTIQADSEGRVRIDVEVVVSPPTRGVLETALKSIANSSCCGCCQEAAKVAKSALGLQ